MAEFTPNYNLKKPLPTDYYNVEDFNENADIIDQKLKEVEEKIDGISIPYAVATGTNTYAVSIPGGDSLVEGMSIKVKFTNANTGASTLNINGLGAKAIQKSNGNALSSGNIKAGQIVHLVYTGSVFQLLGEGGEYGTATAADVLAGKTIGTENGLVTGTIPSKAAATITPTTTSQVIAAGQYLSGAQTIASLGGNATAADVLTGKTFSSDSAGRAIAGTMTNRGAVTSTITTQGGQYTIPQGYHSGSGKVTASFPNLIPENVKAGVNIGGVVGTLEGKKFVQGSVKVEAGPPSYLNFHLFQGGTAQASFLQVSQNFGFVPSIVYFYLTVDGTNRHTTIFIPSPIKPNIESSTILAIHSVTPDIRFYKNISPAYVNENGFRLPFAVILGGLDNFIYWIAIE